MKARCAAVFLTVLIFSVSAQAQNLLGQRADTLAAKLESIRAAKQEVLAPSILGDIEKEVERVRKDLEKGKKPGKIASSLDDAEQQMRDAIVVIRKGLEMFQPVLNARDDATYAKAQEFAENDWKDAEKEFGKAVADLEKGKDDKAKEQVSTLTTLYRTAEFNSIRNQLIVPTLEQLEETEKSDVSKYAPETLKQAREHIAKAEITLNKNRYDVEAVQDEIDLATYEIRHAKYLTDLAVQLEGKKEGVESLMNRIENNFDAVADAVGYDAKYDTGMEKPTQDVAAELRDAVSGAGAENKKLKDQLKQQKTLADSIRVVHRALVDSMETLQSLYALQLQKSEDERAEQARLSNKVATITGLFTVGDVKAKVEGDDLVFEISGLKFSDDDSAVDANTTGPLMQVAGAARQFPMHLAFLKSPALPADASEDVVMKSRKQAKAVLDFLAAQNVLVVDQGVLTSTNADAAADVEAPAETATEDTTAAVPTDSSASDTMKTETKKGTAPAATSASEAVGPMEIVITNVLLFD